MPLFLGGKRIKFVKDVLNFVVEHPGMKSVSEKMLKLEARSVGPKGLLYVNQREFAATLPDDNFVQILGTEDATTCHIVILRHTGSGATCLAHCDGSDTEKGIRNMISCVQKLSIGKPDGRIEVNLAGGFLDGKGESKRLSTSILRTFVDQPEQIHLTSATITDLNDTLVETTHFPVIYGVGVDVKTGEVFPATFPEKGPAMDVRSACHFTGCDKLVNIYDNTANHLVVGPYTWNPWPQVQQWLSVPDSFIRRYMSTSPAQEPKHFEDHVRAALKVIFNHPEPHKTLFVDGKPWTFQKKPSGEWEKL